MSFKVDEITEGTRCALHGAHVSITHHLLSFEYVIGSVFVQKTSSDSFESAVLFVAGEVSFVKGEDATCCGVQRHRIESENVSRCAS